jgi:multicomponent Na+:H+ antiporter subunit B
VGPFETVAKGKKKAMRSIILSTAARFLMPMILLFSAFLLLRGHNLPGGGFVGGLIAAAAFGLYLLAFDVQETRRLLRIDPRTLVGLGLLVVLGSGLTGWLKGKPFLTALWGRYRLTGFLHIEIGTPLIFDAGIYLVVLGSAMTMLLALAEED